MTTHELKTWPDYYAHLVDGTKTFEYRRDDRGFKVGDVLYLREWEPTFERYTGREMHRRVTYLLNVSKDFVVMALESATLDPARLTDSEPGKAVGSATKISYPPASSPSSGGRIAEIRHEMRCAVTQNRCGEYGCANEGATIMPSEWRCHVCAAYELLGQLSAQQERLQAEKETALEIVRRKNSELDALRGERDAQRYRAGVLESQLAALSAQQEALRQERDGLLRDWREQDQILQDIAGLVGDEHVTCASDVLTATKARLASLAPPPRETDEEKGDSQ
jgi:hypothetical protein